AIGRYATATGDAAIAARNDRTRTAAARRSNRAGRSDRRRGDRVCPTRRARASNSLSSDGRIGCPVPRRSDSRPGAWTSGQGAGKGQIRCEASPGGGEEVEEDLSAVGAAGSDDRQRTASSWVGATVARCDGVDPSPARVEVRADLGTDAGRR